MFKRKLKILFNFLYFSLSLSLPLSLFLSLSLSLTWFLAPCVSLRLFDLPTIYLQVTLSKTFPDTQPQFLPGSSQPFGLTGSSLGERRDKDEDDDDDATLRTRHCRNSPQITHTYTTHKHSRTLTRVTKLNFLLQLIYFEMCEIRTINMCMMQSLQIIF